MSSSPTPRPDAQLVRVAALLPALVDLEDPRARRGRRHGLLGLVAVSLCAVLTGARSFAAIGQWAGELDPGQLAQFGLERALAPETSTFRRVFTALDAAALDAVVAAFMWTRTATVSGPSGARRVIAIDGKTVRGARSSTAVAPGASGAPAVTGAPHLVSAYDHATGTTLGQLATAAKSNEIPTVRALLGAFDLTNVVVTLDAMHTQTDTAELITGGGGDYVFTVKANQRRLYAACKALPWSEIPARTGVDTGHGRRVRRTIKVTAVPAWITFTGARQVAQIRRTVTRNGKKTVEVVYVITSADHHAAPPPVLAGWVRGHWGIENRNHWVRDVTYDEDRSTVRIDNAPQVMATLRNTAISLLRLDGHTNIAAALRHHAVNPARPINLVLTS